MEIKRRDFIKSCGAVTTLLLLPGIASAVRHQRSNTSPLSTSRVDKSIKASFGGSFSVQAKTQKNGLTYADIEHLGNHYMVASEDLLDWKILSSNIG